MNSSKLITPNSQNKSVMALYKSLSPTPGGKRNPYVTKWYVLFEGNYNSKLPFIPKAGMTIYPCYACIDIFLNKCSFLDHVNRRGLIIIFRCTQCKLTLKFFNTCTFLLHIREHFNDSGGFLDLNHVEIYPIPIDHAGFLPHERYPRLYDVEDEETNYFLNLNVRFYKPREELSADRYVNFLPNNAVFVPSMSVGRKDMLVLKQVNRNIPCCEFITISSTTSIRASTQTNVILKKTPSIFEIQRVPCIISNSNTSIPQAKKCERVKTLVPIVDNSESAEKVIPSNNNVIPTLKLSVKKIVEKSKEKVVESVPSCSECGEVINNVSMTDHFLEINRPMNDTIKCSKCHLIAPTICSLMAHLRTHEHRRPYICPECGKGFEDWDVLHKHMEDVCFHLAKNVRFRCPGKKCGKVFAQTSTFICHFVLAHMKQGYICNNCQMTSATKLDFVQHSEDEKCISANFTKKLECSLCMCNYDEKDAHATSHVQEKENRMYVYICKYCKSFYRSKQTYATHLLRCTKLLLNNQVKKEAELIESHKETRCRVFRYCRTCSHKTLFECTYKDIEQLAVYCPKCKEPFETEDPQRLKPITIEQVRKYAIQLDDTNDYQFCLLCNQTTDLEIHTCKYMKSTIMLQKCKVSDYINVDYSSEENSLLSSIESGKRKRKRNNYIKNKKRIIEDIPQLPVITPVIFDGSYNCRYCDYKSTSRNDFHVHIQEHKEVSTAFQCMECGECFVVKPSLIKHLQVLHFIDDVTTYMNLNNCYDKEAVRILEQNVKKPPEEKQEPVQENQCKICRQMFPDGQELSKHFRVHGMAFLKEKIVPKSP